MKNKLSPILFWGALWGLEEATLGHLLHLSAINLGWFFWFPLAYFFMTQVFKKTHQLSAVMLTSFVAAGIKLINIWMTPNLLIIICPVLSVVLEGCTFFLAGKLFAGRKKPLNIMLQTFLISLSWRILYVIGILAIPSEIMPIYPYGAINPFIKFVFLEGILNSALILIFIFLSEKTGMRLKRRAVMSKLRPFAVLRDVSAKPALSFCLFVMALFIQWVL